MSEKLEEIVKKIEEKRESLKKQTQSIEIVDYGAGNPSDKRTKEQMEQGVRTTVPLCELAKIGVKKEKAKEIFKIFQTLLPKAILELGTCCGFSSAYMSFFAPESRIWTIEGSENLAKIAKENHKFFGLSNIEVCVGRFDLILPQLLEKIAPLDFIFIDGHHDRDATLEYFRKLLPFVRGGGALLFDDIGWSDGMREAWQRILDSKSYKKASIVGEEPWAMGVLWI